MTAADRAIGAEIRDWRCAGCRRRRPRHLEAALRWNQIYMNGRPTNKLCPHEAHGG
jgi:hypothetical protein